MREAGSGIKAACSRLDQDLHVARGGSFGYPYPDPLDVSARRNDVPIAPLFFWSVRCVKR